MSGGFYIQNDRHVNLKTTHIMIPKGNNLCSAKTRTLNPQQSGSVAYGADTQMLYISFDNKWNPLTVIMPHKEIT